MQECVGNHSEVNQIDHSRREMVASPPDCVSTVPESASITFDVADVAPSPVKFPSYGEADRHYLNSTPAYRLEKCRTVLQESAWSKDRVSRTGHGLIQGIVAAYNQHHRLILRPDDLWLAIMVQFSAYVNGHAEELRQHFVAHTGKQELVVQSSGTLRTADYPSIITAMATRELAKRVTDPTLCDWILPRFSTTTATDALVGSVVFMAAMKSYFDYKGMLMCGIPSITLEGTPEDWAECRSRVTRLRTFGGPCVEWTDMLEPILDQCVAAARGTPDRDFWARICHYTPGGSGPSYLSGWISAFCVFDEDGQWQGDVKSVGRGTLNNAPYPVVELSSVAPGYVTVPMLVDDNGTEHHTVLFAGHAVYTASDAHTVQPLLSWSLFVKDGDEAK